jgi:hypothetical protein
MEQAALERKCAMSLLVILPVGSKVAVSALMRTLSGAKGEFFLVSYVFNSHRTRFAVVAIFFVGLLLVLFIGVTWKPERVAALLPIYCG